MFVSIFILPGSLLVSLAGTVIIVVCISVLVATLVAPPLLAMVGTNINRWRIGKTVDAGRSRLMAFVNAALRRPVLAVLIIGGVVLALAAPAVGLKTGPPSTEQLPTDNQQRQDAEAVDAGAGPGWEAPFILVASTARGPITNDPVFGELTDWQEKVAEDPAVQAVIGPAQVRKKVAPLKKTSNELLGPEGEGSEQLGELRELGPKLERAKNGVAKIRAGLIEAAQGAGLLGEGSGRAEDGRHDDRRAAWRRRRRAANGRSTRIGKLADGAGELAEGQSEAKVGSLSVKLGLSGLLKNFRSGGLGKARKLRSILQHAAADGSLAGGGAEPGAAARPQPVPNRNEIKHLRGESQRLHARRVETPRRQHPPT